MHNNAFIQQYFPTLLMSYNIELSRPAEHSTMATVS